MRKIGEERERERKEMGEEGVIKEGNRRKKQEKKNEDRKNGREDEKDRGRMGILELDDRRIKRGTGGRDKGRK